MMRLFAFFFVGALALLGALFFSGVLPGLISGPPQNTERADTATNVQDAAEEGDLCAAFTDPSLLSAFEGSLEEKARASKLAIKLASEIVGVEVPEQTQILYDALKRHLIDRTLCEEIRLASGAGELHPLIGVLEYAYGAVKPCEKPQNLSLLLRALSSHRGYMIHSLFLNMDLLQCLPPGVSLSLSRFALEEVHKDPLLFDDLDMARVAGFLTSRTPVDAAGFACEMEASKTPSKLAEMMGCSDTDKSEILTRYRYEREAGSEVEADFIPESRILVLLSRDGEMCKTRSVKGPSQILKLRCSDLHLLSNLEIAFHIDEMKYGAHRLSLATGLALVHGESQRLSPSRRKPSKKIWYGYSQEGALLGLSEISHPGEEKTTERSRAGQKSVMRSFCEKSGARYCFDVDWAESLTSLSATPSIYTSRPVNIFYEPILESDLLELWANEVFGIQKTKNAELWGFQLENHGSVLGATQEGRFQIAWRASPSEKWQKQSFGGESGKGQLIKARMVVVLNLKIGMGPTLVVQRDVGKKKRSGVVPLFDDVLIMTLNPEWTRFSEKNRLTLHEF
ncbi:hypothetical protein KAI87_02185 [Myxococcota bacterium]|nr:hypothetical protein [Myxococcota bacterium]